MIHGHEIDPPDELPCRECWDRENKPNPRDVLQGALEGIMADLLNFESLAKTHAVAASEQKWFMGFAGAVEAAYQEVVSDVEWTTCSRCAAENRADEARE